LIADAVRSTAPLELRPASEISARARQRHRERDRDLDRRRLAGRDPPRHRDRRAERDERGDVRERAVGVVEHDARDEERVWIVGGAAYRPPAPNVVV
jgi:hypothetical protein